MPSHADSRLVRVLCRLYDALLLAYPSDFRRDFGDEMRLTVKNDIRVVVEHRGMRALMSFTLRILRDWLMTLAREWKDSSDALCSLRLNGTRGFARTDTERQSRALSAMLVALGMCLLIVGWLRWIDLTGVRR